MRRPRWTRLYCLRESLAFGNGRWHLAVCPYCRGMSRYVDEQEAAS